MDKNSLAQIILRMSPIWGTTGKGTLTSFSTERTLTIFSFAGPGTIKQARSNLPKVTRKKADSLPN